MKNEDIGSAINKDYNRVSAMHGVIKKLRYDNLKEGHCFMIFDDDLPENQAYYEYPDGRIQIEQLNDVNLDIPRLVIRALTQYEIVMVRQKHEVFR